MDTVNRFCLGEDGQDLVEYSLLLVIVAMGTILILQQTGSSITPIWAAGSSTVQNAALQTS
jgi:Flp pilus assembly pilin Flp